MTPFVKFLRNSWEKAFGKFYEGPQAPDRVENMVVAFMKMNPHATRKEWAAFAARHAAEAYASGYSRGFEWAERDLDRLPKDSPEVKDHDARHSWAWEGGGMIADYEPVDIDDVVADDDEAIRRSLDVYEKAVREQRAGEVLGHRYGR